MGFLKEKKISETRVRSMVEFPYLPNSIIKAILAHKFNQEQSRRFMDVVFGCSAPNGEDECGGNISFIVLFDLYIPEENRWNHDIPIPLCDDQEHLCYELYNQSNNKSDSATIVGITHDQNVRNIRVIPAEKYLKEIEKEVAKN